MTALDDKTVVELEGVNGEVFIIAGPDCGDKGVYLATGVKGLFDPPVKTVWEEPGNWPGARYLNHRILRRDIVFGVEIMGDTAEEWLRRDSQWRRAWAFDQDCVLRITTPESGTRWLKLRLGQQMDTDDAWFTDPRLRTINRVALVCVAADPFWYSDDEVFTAVTTEDTRFDPNTLNLPWPWPHHQLPVENLTISVDACNPTDQVIFPKWTVPGSTEKPADPWIPGLPWLGAPKSKATIWTLPDYSFRDDEQSDRRLRLPALIGGLRTREVQEIIVDGKPTSGTFKLKYGTETTVTIPFNATPKQIRDALVALASIAAGDVLVERMAAVNERQTLYFTGGATGGTFTLSFDGVDTAALPFNATSAQIESALVALPAITLLDLDVSAKATNCVQKLTMVGEPKSGVFTLSLDGEETVPMPWNASDTDVYAGITSLASVNNIDVTVSGNRGGPWTVTFLNRLDGIDVNPLVADTSELFGGAGIDLQVKLVRRGGKKYTFQFQNKLGGQNMPQITADVSQLTGGKDPAAVITTDWDGARPYRVTFLGNLEGVDVPLLVGDSTGLVGTGVRVLTRTLVEGKTAPAENAVIDSDPRVEQVVSESGSQLWSRMNGVRFKHGIPARTYEKDFEVSVSGCKPGQMVTLRLPRPWSRPWGLE